MLWKIMKIKMKETLCQQLFIFVIIKRLIFHYHFFKKGSQRLELYKRLTTIVKGDLKAPFSIATRREGATPFSRLLHFILNMYLIMLSVKQGCNKYHFWDFGVQSHIELYQSPGPLGNTLPTRSIADALKLKTAQYQLAGIYIKEQTEYIQNQIDKIRDSVEDRQSRIA